MFLYTPEAMDQMDSAKIKSEIDNDLVDANNAMENSKINLEFIAVYKGQVREVYKGLFRTQALPSLELISMKHCAGGEGGRHGGAGA